MECNVNHPKHYNSNKSGVECIEIIRWYCNDIGNAYKYLWRCGLKTDSTMSLREKEDEDINKAIWYINDRIKQVKSIGGIKSQFETNPFWRTVESCCSTDEIKVFHPSGYELNDFTNDYVLDVANAMKELWICGLLTHIIDTKEELKRLEKAKDYLYNHLDRPYDMCCKEKKNKEILFS